MGLSSCPHGPALGLVLASGITSRPVPCWQRGWCWPWGSDTVPLLDRQLGWCWPRGSAPVLPCASSKAGAGLGAQLLFPSAGSGIGAGLGTQLLSPRAGNWACARLGAQLQYWSVQAVGLVPASGLSSCPSYAGSLAGAGLEAQLLSPCAGSGAGAGLRAQLLSPSLQVLGLVLASLLSSWPLCSCSSAGAEVREG